MARNLFPMVMKTTALLTGIATAALTVVHHFFPETWLLSTAISVGTIFYHFAMRLAVGAIVPLFTKCVNPSHPWFRPQHFEAPLYKMLKLRRWKGKLPTYDPSQFDLEKNSLAQVVRNMCNAELVHEVILFLSFIPLFFAIPFGDFPVFFITSVCAALYDGIFVMAQRANRPRLMRILKKKEARP